MRWTAVTLLIGLALSGPAVEAQHGAGMAAGARVGAVGPARMGMPAPIRQHGPVLYERPFWGFGRGGWCGGQWCGGRGFYGGWGNYYSVGYGDGFWWPYASESYGDSYFQSEETRPSTDYAATSPVVIYLQNPQQPSAPARTPNPGIIDIPQDNTAKQSATPLPPTVFILANGQSLELKRYTLTQTSLSFTKDYVRRVVPTSQINLEATVAANQKRGVDLRIPESPNQVTIGF